MLKIRLTLKGKKKQRTFRIVVVDSRKKRDTKNIVEDLGFYNPQSKEIFFKHELADKWLGFGAQYTSTVSNLIKKHFSERVVLN